MADLATVTETFNNGNATLDVSEKNDRKEEIQEVTDFLLDYAISLMAAGAYTGRIVKNVRRIGEAYGYIIDILLFQKNMTMTVTDPGDYSIRRTYVRQQLPLIHVSFNTISNLSMLSWKAFDTNTNLETLRLEYSLIISKHHEDWRLLLLFASFATAAFCRLFGGDWGASVIVFFAAFAGFLLRKLLTAIKVEARFTVLLTATTSSLVAFLGSGITNYTSTSDIAVATSVLYLVPGVHFINSVIDILDGHILIGISRAVNTCILIICIAFGMYFTLTVMGKGVL